MRKCPKCGNYSIEFDSYFKRPRCYDCGWLPSTFPKHIRSDAFEICDHCWGYSELRGLNGQCINCGNKGKVLSALGKDVAEIVKEIIK